MAHRWLADRPTCRTLAALPLAALLSLAGACSPGLRPGTDAAAAPAALERGRELYARGAAACGPALVELAGACAEAASCGAALPYLADCFNARQQMERGADFFQRVAERHPPLAARATDYRGFFLERAGYFEEAVEHYARALQAPPGPLCSQWRGKLLERIGRPREAVETLRAGLAVAPDDAQLHFLLGRTLRLSGRLNEARAELERAVELDPGHGFAWVNLGQIRAAQGEPEQALAAWNRALEADPDNIEARFMLAKRALREERLAEVEEQLREIRRIEATLGRGPRED